mgnify:FL=1
MARFIAFDYGARRIGVAVTDSGAMIAAPECTCSPKELERVIGNMVAAEPCAGFVVGQPGLLTGERTHSSEGIAAFAAGLKKRFPEIPVHFVDEDHTSREASLALIQGGMRKSKRREKGNLDKVAAAIILQRFLDARP